MYKVIHITTMSMALLFIILGLTYGSSLNLVGLFFLGLHVLNRSVHEKNVQNKPSKLGFAISIAAIVVSISLLVVRISS